MSEFLVRFNIAFPPGTDPALIKDLYAAETAAAQAFFPRTGNGMFKRCWRIAGTRNHLALWEAPSADDIHRAYESFPLWQAGYGVVGEMIPLAINPNDPGDPAWHDQSRISQPGIRFRP